LTEALETKYGAATMINFRPRYHVDMAVWNLDQWMSRELFGKVKGWEGKVARSRDTMTD